MADSGGVGIKTDFVSVLVGFQNRFDHRGQVMPIVAESMVSAVHEEFDTAGHGTWDPLAPATLAARRQHGKGAEPLKNNGVFAGSITPDYGPESAAAYTNVPYAVYHVSQEARTVIPYRNPFDIPMDRIQEEAAELLLSVLAP